jgi:primosomal protein N' (replication factor Y)
MMRFVEVIVNVPIRRSYRPDQPPPAPMEEGESAEPSTGPALQIFHYHLPAELEGVVRPGHLVWAPFGRQQVQGVVVRLSDRTPVATKPLSRLARPDPVLTPSQLELATWIADQYVAPLSEAMKLFLPPGLLVKEEQGGVRAKREIEITLVADVATIAERLPTLGRSPKYGAILRTLQEAGQPLWKSDLYARVDADLAALRKLQAAGLVRLTERMRLRDPVAGRNYPYTKPPVLTSEQARVWQTVRDAGFWAAWSAEGEGNAPTRAAKFLLHGVTGSGKTEIYLRAIDQTLALGRQAIVLVPEIALAPQTVARFAGRFPGRVTVIHSALNRGERYDVWRLVREGGADVVIGPRSALFAPLPRLGLIILDEEHESSYKQDSEEWGSFTVFYDARTVAHKLAELTGSMLILGSATPSLESYQAALRGELTLLEMPRRVVGHRPATTEGEDAGVIYGELPPVEIVDMRQELRAGNRSVLSRSLQAELHATLDAGEQAIFFLNRRGTNTFVMCRDCGAVQECPRCELPLTYHENANQLVCHHCNRRFPIPTLCPQCQSKRIKYFGAGTQRLEEYISQIEPRARVLRWDADTTGARGSHDAILQRFATHQADVLVGTQMIAKGLDLPLVTLVGVVAADVGLFLPDFRSGERTFQLLTQVAGRAGRSARGGRVIIQSYRPEHYAIQAAAQHDYAAFYEREIRFRHEHGYPPTKRLARLVYWDKKFEKAQAAAEKMAEMLRYRIDSLGLAGEAATVMGPAPAFFARMRSYYRWQLLLRAPDPAGVLRGLAIPFGWRVDIDPMSIL